MAESAWVPLRQIRHRARRLKATWVQEHEHCSELDGSVEGDCLWMTCTCGAVINRNADD